LNSGAKGIFFSLACSFSSGRCSVADKDSRKGTVYHDPGILEYVQKIHAAHDCALEKAFGAPSERGLPAIQVGPSEGRLLQVLLLLVHAVKVVEIGTLAGYSAIWIARSLPDGGHLWSIEVEPNHAAIARENLAQAGLLEKVTVVEGEALEVLPSLDTFGPFDAVFIDADKGNYDRYGAWAGEHVRHGGLLMADNAFYFGELLNNSPEALAVRRFHEEARKNFETVCVPTPDGLLVGFKK
jgi:caffeoyl-CoA O-methyltransferase